MNLKKLAKERKIIGQEKYGELYKSKTFEQLKKEIREELADALNYALFIQELTGIDMSKWIFGLEALDENLDMIEV